MIEMTEAEAQVEAQRILGLLEDNADYRYLTSVQATVEADDPTETEHWWVGVGWVATIHGKEYGNWVALNGVGTSINAIRRMVHQNYLRTMARR